MKFDLGKFLAVVAQIGPVILAATPGASKFAPLVPVIVGAIGDAQAIKGASGEEKKSHVLNILAASVAAANATGKVNLDAGEVTNLASVGIDNVVATVKIITGSKVAVDAPAPADAKPAAGD